MAVEAWVIQSTDENGLHKYWSRKGFVEDIRDAIFYKREDTAHKNGPSSVHKRVRIHIALGANCLRATPLDPIADTPIAREIARRARKV